MWLEMCSCRWFLAWGDLKTGMTDFFHVGELILRPQLTDDLNDFMSASAAHMTVTNTLIQFCVMTMVRQLCRSCG